MNVVADRYYGAVAPEREGQIVGPHGNRIWYRVNGEASPGTPLLIVHGGPGFSHHYLLSLVDLAAQRPVYFYDQTDCGHSDRFNDPRTWNIEHFVEEIGVVRSALGLQHCFLAGHSWGGLITASYAARHSEGLEGLLLLSPAISEPRWEADAGIRRRSLPPEMRETLDHHERVGTRDSSEYKLVLDEYSARFFCRMPKWPEDIMETFHRINEPLTLAMWGATDFSADPGTPVRGHDGTIHLSRIQMPTLVTAGKFDTCSPQAAREYAEQLPAGEAVVFSEAAHSAQYEAREEFMVTLNRWMHRVETRSGNTPSSR